MVGASERIKVVNLPPVLPFGISFCGIFGTLWSRPVLIAHRKMNWLKFTMRN
jgi:hypothetical protein